MRDFFIAVGRPVFKAEVAVIAAVFCSLDDHRVVCLAELQLVAAGDTCGMEVADKINVVRDVVDEIALHQLHVVAVEQELDGTGESTALMSSKPL